MWKFQLAQRMTCGVGLQASTNSSFMHEPSLHLAVYVAVEAVSWEAVLHRALASLDAQPHATRHGDVSIVEQKATLDGCSAKHQLTLLGVAHWLVRGVGMTEPELRATFVVGKQYQVPTLVSELRCAVPRT